MTKIKMTRAIKTINSMKIKFNENKNDEFNENKAEWYGGATWRINQPDQYLDKQMKI